MKVLSLINRLQQGRFLWILMAVVTLGLTAVAHYFFQDYLFMQPCEQCVYIRFAMITMAIGGILAAVYPSNATRIIGYILGFYGCLIGIGFCLKLDAIHHAVHAANAFGGVEGCRQIPVFPFALPLHEWSEGWFLPTGDCGLDNPLVPEDEYANLSAIQQFFVGTEAGDFEDGFYSNGWYLIPSLEFMNMAIACLLCFVCCLLALLVMFIGFVSDECKHAKTGAAVVVVVVAILYFVGNSMKEEKIKSESSGENKVSMIIKN